MDQSIRFRLDENLALAVVHGKVTDSQFRPMEWPLAESSHLHGILSLAPIYAVQRWNDQQILKREAYRPKIAEVMRV